jgi:poly-gamma-glutamate capsule biosynthesis protein CapA/YwtB (metallophosphatase superfamily)
MVVGDVVLAQSTGRRIIKNGPDAPWRKVAGFLDQAELFMINLECPISGRGTSWPGEKYTLRARPASADALPAAGVDVANHTAWATSSSPTSVVCRMTRPSWTSP